MNRRIKIILILVVSFILSSIINNIFFLGKTPRAYKLNLSSLMSTFKKVPVITISPTIAIKKPKNNYSVTNTIPPPAISQTIIKKTISNSPTPIINRSKIIPTNIPNPTVAKIPTTAPSPTQYIAPTEAPTIPYPSSSNNSYGTIEILSAPTDRPAEQHPDINLSIRGYVPTNGSTALTNLDGDTDLKAPQFTTLLSDNPNPPIIRLYKVYEWNWSANSRGGLINDPNASMFGLAVTPGEPLHVLQSQYDIGGGYQVMVLYANRDSIVMKYSREDNVVIGYTVHVMDIWVDPNLVALYNQMNAAGRGSLPALGGGDIYGIARSNEAKFVMRDTGAFMDIRSRKDWWH